MKYKIVLLFVLFPVLAQAQKIPGLDSVVNNVINDLKESWTLGVDSNSTTVDIGMYNKYKKLFADSATIDDDLNFQFIPEKKSGFYKIDPVPKDFDVYAHDVALQVTKIIIDSSWEYLPSKKTERIDPLIVIIKRKVYVEKPAKYVLQDLDAIAGMILKNHAGIKFEKRNENKKGSPRNEMILDLKEKLQKYPDSLFKFNFTSTMRITMTYNDKADSLNPVKIVRIQNAISSVSCSNDTDKDGIVDQLDILPARYGDFTAQGAPDEDLDGVADTDDKCPGTYGSVENKGCPEPYFIFHKFLDGFAGVQYNTPKINMPELNQLGYTESGVDATDVLQSQKGVLKNTIPVTGIYAAGNFGYFFGKDAKRRGVSVGFTYSRFVANYELTDPAVYTYKAFDSSDYYRRQVTLNTLKEEIAYSVINIPVQFNYRKKTGNGDHWVLNFKAGPSLMIFNVTSNYNTNIDFGGIYQIDTVYGNKIIYYNYFDPNSSWNVYVTADGINNQNTNPGAANVFAQLSNNSQYLDFAAHKNYRDQKKMTRMTVAFNLSFDAQYKGKRESPVAVKFGFHGVYAPFTQAKEKYKPIDKTSDTFSSIFNSNAKAAYLAYGVHLGLVYDF